MTFWRAGAAVLGIVLAGVVSATAADGQETAAAKPQNPHDLVLEQSKGDLIRLKQKAASVFVANPEIANVQVKSPRLIYIFGQTVGQTTLFAVDQDDHVIARKSVQVTHNLTALRNAVAALEPPDSVSIDTVNQSLVIKGTVQSSEMAENIRRLSARFTSEDDELINQLQVAGPTQVNLRVRVAEVQRTIAKQIGVNWDASLSAGDFLFGLTKGSLLPGSEAFGGSVTGSSGDLSIDSLINVLAEEGLVTVLAEPNLTALSGETASFLAGGEFPIPVPDDNEVVIEFREFGVSLNFTPTLLGNDRISLKVAPEVSELDFANGVTIQGFRVPALNTRRAATTVELGSGQSFAIAGLLQNTSNQSISKLPGLGDVPVLGALFRSDDFQRDETELVIIVTPYIVEPSEQQQMAAPTDGLLPPNDIDRLLFGRTHGKDTSARAQSETPLKDRGLSGSAGFMLE